MQLAKLQVEPPAPYFPILSHSTPPSANICENPATETEIPLLVSSNLVLTVAPDLVLSLCYAVCRDGGRRTQPT